MYVYDTTAGSKSQIEDLLLKLKPKKDWAQKSQIFLEKHVSDIALRRHIQCGDYITLLTDESGEKRKVETAFFCGNRLCPGCAWRASLKSAATVAAISQHLAEQGRIMLFVTLTVPNVRGGALRDEIQAINRAWDKLVRRKAYRVWADNIRKLEITYNPLRDDFHPHLHVVVYVSPGYFKGQNYISQAQLLKDWRTATGDESITQVDVRRCKDQPGRSNAILEVSKYTAKASDYTQTELIFDTMYGALHHTRTMTFSGLCRAAKTDFEGGRLDHLIPQDTTQYVYRLIYRYYADLGYVQVDTRDYIAPPPPGFHEVGIAFATPWDAPNPSQLAEVT